MAAAIHPETFHTANKFDRTPEYGTRYLVPVGIKNKRGVIAVSEKF